MSLSIIIPIFMVLTQPAGNKIYSVIKINEDLSITGKGDSKLWHTANELSDFIYPWENGKPPLTSFKALHNTDWLYCLFTIHDDDIRIYIDTNDKSEAVYSDRAEIFFKKDDQLTPYYCLEVDPQGRVFDYKAEYYRKVNKQWSWPSGHLIVKTNQEKPGYTIEIAISKTSLKELGLLMGKRLYAGLYRAECVALEGKDATFKWISWVNPQSEHPDFHIASSFGLLTFED